MQASKQASRQASKQPGRQAGKQASGQSYIQDLGPDPGPPRLSGSAPGISWGLAWALQNARSGQQGALETGECKQIQAATANQRYHYDLGTYEGRVKGCSAQMLGTAGIARNQAARLGKQAFSATIAIWAWNPAQISGTDRTRRHL